MNVRDLVPWGRNDHDLSLSAGNEPGNPILTLHREMNRMFDDVFRGLDTPFSAMSRGYGPTLDIDETDTEYRVTAELAGLGKDDVEIVFDDGVLSIRGEKHDEKREGRGITERWFGRFERRVALPDADETGARADFRDGLLTVSLPKTQRAREKVRRIPINDISATTH